MEEHLDNNYLLLGGNGFLGKNLQELMNKKNKKIFLIDRKDCDLSSYESINFLNCVIVKNKITHIINLASNVGIDLFLSDKAINFAYENMQMLLNFIQLIKLQTTPIDITWYSTSEVFGSTVTLDNFSFNPAYIRSSYSQIKLLGETLLNDLQKKGYIKNLHIIRPFNPSGKWQKRGLLYGMLKSAILDNKIVYCRNTTRMIQNVKDFTEQTFDDIVLNSNTCKNYYDFELSSDLKNFAIIVSKYVETFLNKKVALIENKEDEYIQYRHVNNLKDHTQIIIPVFNILKQISI